MRKQNSIFQTAFISEAGSGLENNDYFAYVELDKYACYVIADGLNELPDQESALLAAQKAILTFQQHPSMSSETLCACLKAANKALCETDSRERLKASILIAVTDYETLRYGYAGNTRLRLYRSGAVIEQSQDMSLGSEIVGEKKLTEDMLARHEERNNLYSYAGQGANFSVSMSKKIRLQNGDIIALYTRGIWENLDSGELDDVFSEAGEEPKKSLDDIEDMLLTKQPKNLDNYTFAVVFVNKIFLDPNRKRKIKTRIKISLITAVLILLLILLIWFVRYRRQQWLETLELQYTNIIEYMQDGNFLRAEEECKEALATAEKLKEKKRIQKISDYQKLIEAVNTADEIYSAGNYDGAQEAFLTAQERSRYADHIADAYIGNRLERIASYRAVFDYIQLGDTLSAQRDYDGAEGKYLEAKRLATNAYYEEGRKQAMEALEAMYAGRESEQAATTQEAQSRAESEVTAASLAAEGDKAFAAGDFESAKLYYTTAIEKYQELGDTAHVQMLQTKIDSSRKKSAENQAKKAEAEGYIAAARQQEAAGDKLEAKRLYLFAKNLYRELKSDDKVEEVNTLLEILENNIAAEDKKTEKSKAPEQSEGEMKATVSEATRKMEAETDTTAWGDS